MQKCQQQSKADDWQTVTVVHEWLLSSPGKRSVRIYPKVLHPIPAKLKT
jgi:hypothetical protein